MQSAVFFMNIDKLTLFGIDYTEGLARFSGMKDIYEESLKYMLNENSIEYFLTAIDMKNYDEAFRHIHTLKGVLGNLSIKPLYEQSSQIVDALRKQDYEKVKEVIPVFELNYRKTINCISESID